MHIRKILFLLLLVFCCKSATLFAQIDTLHLYYNINQKDVNLHRQKLDSAFVADKIRIEAIHVIGYTDYLGSKPYNSTLSLNRADNIKAYLQQLLPGIGITSEGKGEQASYKQKTSKGSPKDRRVDVMVLRTIPLLPMPDTLTVINHADPVFRDTTFEAKVDKLPTLKPGERIDIDELLFIGGRHFLTRASYKYVDILAELLRKHPKLKIQLIGHICCQYDVSDGYDLDNHKFGLSRYRAEFVYNYLVKAGIEKGRMTYKGVGSTDPKIFPERSSHDADLNRRVEIVVVSNNE